MNAARIHDTCPRGTQGHTWRATHQDSSSAWRRLRRLPGDEQGPVTLLALFFGLLVFSAISLVWNTGQVTQKKIQVQSAADSAAYTSAMWMSRGVNIIAATNMQLLRDGTAAGMSYQVELLAHYVSVLHYFISLPHDVPVMMNSAIDNFNNDKPWWVPIPNIPTIPPEFFPGAALAKIHIDNYREEINRVRKAAGLGKYKVADLTIGDIFSAFDPFSLIGAIGSGDVEGILNPITTFNPSLEDLTKFLTDGPHWMQKVDLSDHIDHLYDLQENVHAEIGGLDKLGEGMFGYSSKKGLIEQNVDAIADYYGCDIEISLGGDGTMVKHHNKVQAPVTPMGQPFNVVSFAGDLADLVLTEITLLQPKIIIAILTDPPAFFNDPGSVLASALDMSKFQDVLGQVLRPAIMPYGLRFLYEVYGVGSWVEDEAVKPDGKVTLNKGKPDEKEIPGLNSQFLTSKAYDYIAVFSLFMGYLHIIDKHSTIKNSQLFLEFGPFATLPDTVDPLDFISEFGQPDWRPYTVVAVARDRGEPTTPTAPRLPAFRYLARGLFGDEEPTRTVAYAQAETFNGIDGFLDTFNVGGSGLLAMMYSIYPWRVWTTWGMQWQPRLTHGDLIPKDVLTAAGIDLGSFNPDLIAVH